MGIPLDDSLQLARRQLRHLADGAPTADGPREQRETLDILIGIQALATVGTNGRNHSVTSLPSAQQIRREPGA